VNSILAVHDRTVHLGKIPNVKVSAYMKCSCYVRGYRAGKLAI